MTEKPKFLEILRKSVGIPGFGGSGGGFGGPGGGLLLKGVGANYLATKNES